MKDNGYSEHHQNNNLKVVIAFGNFIGKDNSFLDIKVSIYSKVDLIDKNDILYI